MVDVATGYLDDAQAENVFMLFDKQKSDIAYEIGVKAFHNNKYWINEYPANIYEPGVFGWVIQEND